MSKEIGYIKRTGRDDGDNELHITSFYGGEKRGSCIQLTAREEKFNPMSQKNQKEYQYIQICYEDYITLKKVMDEYFHDHVNKEQTTGSEFVKSDDED